MTNNGKKQPQPRPRKKRNPTKKSTISGVGDYELQDAAVRKLQSTVDKIDRKLPDVKSGVASFAPKAGAMLGGLFGQPALGSALASGASKILGFGDYTISSNSLIPGPTMNRAEALVPKFGNGTNSVRIREREYLGDLISSATPGLFSVASFQLNPSNPSTFPWASNIAILYEQWYVHGMVLEFNSTSSEYNGASQALGSVIMATDYNAFDPPFSSKQIMENQDFANSTKPSCSAVHGIECDPNQRPTPLMYIQNPPGMPITSSVLGNFQIASQGVSVASVNLGEIWISYDISFYKKSIENPSPLSVYFNSFGTIPNNSFALATNGAANGSSSQFVLNNLAGTGSILSFPPLQTSGSYIFWYYWFTASTGWLSPTALVNCNLTAGYVVTNALVGSPAVNIATVEFTITGPGASFTLPIWIGGATSYNCFMVPVSTNIRL